MKKIIIKLIIGLYAALVLSFVVNFSRFDFSRDILMIIEVVLLIISSLVLIIINHKTEKAYDWISNKLDDTNDIIYQTEKSTELLINVIPYAIASLNEDLYVTWCNETFLEYFNFETYKEAKLSTYCKELEDALRTGQADFDLNVNEKHYKVYYDSEFNTVALYDITNEFVVRKQFNDSLLAIGIIKFDVLEEILSGGDVVEQNEIQSNYFKLVTEYFVSRNIYIQNVSNSTFMVVMKKFQLEELLKDEISILKTIKLENNKFRVTITLSAGIACYDEEYTSLHQRAKDALVIAEQRGGDQAIVDIEGEEIKYFGGTQEATEKRSRIRSRILAGRIASAIEDANNIFIVSHTMSDTDAVGAMVGVNAIVKSYGKKAHIVYEEKYVDETAHRFVEDLNEFNDSVIDFQSAKNLVEENSLIFVVDCNSEQQIMLKNFVKKSSKVIIIDHHRRSKNTYNNTLLEYIEPYASSTTELVTELTRFQNNDLTISYEEATVMYSGIVVDTNNFTARTGSRTFDAASLLRSYGADIDIVKYKLRDDIQTVFTITKMVSTVEIFKDRYAFVTSDEILPSVVLAKAANSILNIDKVDACFIIARLKPDKVKISSRSLGEVNVQIIMEKLGGGGHFSAAACEIEGKTIGEIEQMTKEILESM